MTNAELEKVVDNQKNTIGFLTSRVGQLADDLAVLKGEVETFKGHVVNDMKRVVEALQKNR